MATPKIKIKRGSGPPPNLTAGELAIDTSNYKFYIQTADGGTPSWMGSPIDDSTWNNNSNLATQSLINTRFMPKTGGTFTGTVSGTGFSGTGFTSSGNVTTKTLKLEDPGDSDSIEIKAPSMSGNSYSLTLPASLTAGVMKVDGSGNVSFSADSIGVDIAAASSSTTYYPMLATGIGTVSQVYIDNVAGFNPVNGPLAYTPSTGTLTINGDLNVNGQAVPVTLSAANYGITGYPSNFANSVNFIHVSSVTGVYKGDIIEIVTGAIGSITITFVGGVSTATITAVDPATNKITVDTNFSVSGTLTATQSNSIQIKYQSLSAKISASNSTVVNAEVFNQNVDNIKIGTAATVVDIGNNNLSTVSIGPVLNIAANTIGNTSVINTAGTTASFAQTNSTTVNIGNAATIMNLGGTSTDNLTYKFGDNATASTKTKTINIGTSGASGSTTNIVLGAQNGTNSHTVYGSITNTAGSSPSGSDQLVTKGYVDTAAVGLSTKGSAVAATTGTLASITGGTISYTATTITWANGTAVAASTGATLAIDGVNIYYGDAGDPTAASPGSSVVILVKDEAATARNGLYYVSGARTLTRISTADTALELPKGTYIFVSGGTLNGGKGYITNAAVSTLGSDPIVWNQFTQSTTYVGSAPISVAGNSISLNYSTSSFDLSGNNLKLKSTVAGNGLTYTNEVLSVSSSITVKAATTANLDLSTDISTVDNVSLSVGDIYLVKNQTNPALNGIWQRVSGAQPTRSSLYNTQTLINGTRTIYVSSNNSSVNGGKSFTLSTPASSTVSTQSNPNAGGPILYIENNTGTSYTPDNYYTIGAPLDKTADAAAKVYYLNDIYHGSATSTFTLNGNSYLTVKIAGWSTGDLRNIPADIVPGLKITKFGSADFSSYSIYIHRIDRVGRTIILYNRNSTPVSSVTIAASARSDTAGSGVTLEIENTTGGNSYYSTPKGILVYNKKDFSEWSALQFTPNAVPNADGFWSIINSSEGGNLFNSTVLVGDTSAQTLKNKTLDNTNLIDNSTLLSPRIQITDSNQNTNSVLASDVTGTGATWYTTSPAVFDVAQDTYLSSPDQPFSVTRVVHNLRTGTKLTVTTTGSPNITSGTYYAIVTGPNAIKFASSYANALTGTSITRSSSSTVDSSNTIKIIASSVDITLGGGGEGSFGYIRMPSIDNDVAPYEYVFGDSRDITTSTSITVASVNQGAVQSGDTYRFSTVTTNVNTVYAYDTPRTSQNVNLGTISAISGNQGSDTVTITFANTNSFTTNDWVTIAGITNTHVTTQADRKTLNYAHKVNAATSGTSVTLKLRTTLASNINVSVTGTVVAVKNYEIYFVCKNNPEFKLGSTVTFSNDGVTGINETKIRGVYTDSDIGNGSAITYTITSLANVTGVVKGFGVRVPYICMTLDGTTLTATPNPNYVNQGLSGNSSAKNIRGTVTPPTDNASYTGRRILMNTLIDCGSY